MSQDHQFVICARYAMVCGWVVLLIAAGVVVCASKPDFLSGAQNVIIENPLPEKPLPGWLPPDSTSVPGTPEGKMIQYGRELVSHTAIYLGPNGKVMAMSNGMNCQNCHLKAGTLPYGNNYSAVASTYPKFRERSGTVESVEKRVNDCLERSLNGKKLADDSKEMRAFVAYIRWVGKDVPKGKPPVEAGIKALPFLNRAADPTKGKIVFQSTCARCHGQDGKGQRNENGLEWKYPPLHGEDSFNSGAGLFRITRFAGYIKANMPNDLATYKKPVLTDEAAWDVAAYVLSLPRPSMDLSGDWPDMATKPVDHPFGPYTDKFTEVQHKYGPFLGMKEPAKKKK